MVANIEEVLQRGEALSGKSMLSQGLFGSNRCSVSFWIIKVRRDAPRIHWFLSSSVSLPPSFFHSLLFLSFALNSFSLSSGFSSPSALDSKASNLSSLSKKYRSDAKYLNTRSTYAKLAAGGVFFIMLIVYVRFWWLWEGKEKERKEVVKWKMSCTESADTKKSRHLRLKTGSLPLLRLCRHTTAHFVLACPWMCDLNINDVMIHSFIINNDTVMRE